MATRVREVKFDGDERKRLDAIQASADKVLEKIVSNASAGGIWEFGEIIWPASRGMELSDVDLELRPLSRFSQVEGKSGSKVLIGQFVSAVCEGSHFLVIKTRPQSERNKLREEHDAAVRLRPFAAARPDSFSIPFDCTCDGGYEVLWSLCMVSSPRVEDDDPETAIPVIEDLRAPLKKGDHATALSVLEAAYRVLRNLHRRGRVGEPSSRTISLGAEYARYLRDPDSWQSNWSNRLRNSRAGDLVDLLDKVKSLEFSGQVGAVHGDLHPGNIVLRTDGTPVIIDFGWALSDGHLVKDFVLMECNLRFSALPPYFAESELCVFAQWVEWEREPQVDDPYLRGQVKLIKQLHKLARTVMKSMCDWDREYLAPLFLVAFGLLRFSDQHANQQAGFLFLEALGMHLQTRLQHIVGTPSP